MREKIKPSKLYIVAILLAAYSSVYVTEFLCNFEDGFEQFSQQHTHKAGPDHHDVTSAANEKHDHSHDHNSDDDDCCKDLTSSFVSDLPKLITPTFELKVKTLNCPFFIRNFSPKYDCLTTQLTPSHYKLPPPKIPDIRVFIQSFII